MLTPNQVLPFLQHPDSAVRNHAVRYLVGSMDCGPATADDLWRCIDRFGAEGRAMCLDHLNHLPQTQYSYTRLMESLRHVTDNFERIALEQAYGDLSLDLLVRNRDEILAMDTAPEDLRCRHRLRLAHETTPFEDLWGILLQVADVGFEFPDDEQYVGEFDEKGLLLVEALVLRFPQEAAARALDTLRAIPVDAETDGVLDEYCIDILGRTRHRAAVPLLLERLEAGDEMLNGATARTLARLGDGEMVRRLEAMYRDEASEVEWFTVVGILDGINIPETEQTLVRLFRSERDFELSVALADALVRLCASPDALDRVWDFIDPTLERTQIARLMARIIPAAIMAGRTSSEVEPWRLKLEELRTRYREVASRLASMPAVQPAEPVAPAIQPVGTIHRSGPKIGRNDACPCGSGKKYKKCCMKD